LQDYLDFRSTIPEYPKHMAAIYSLHTAPAVHQGSHKFCWEPSPSSH